MDSARPSPHGSNANGRSTENNFPSSKPARAQVPSTAPFSSTFPGSAAYRPLPTSWKLPRSSASSSKPLSPATAAASNGIHRWPTPSSSAAAKPSSSRMNSPMPSRPRSCSPIMVHGTKSGSPSTHQAASRNASHPPRPISIPLPSTSRGPMASASKSSTHGSNGSTHGPRHGPWARC